MDQTQLIHLATALGVGLLIGAERERRKRQQAQPAAAGIRTFAVSAVAGALGYLLGGALLLGAVMLAVTVFAAVSAWRIGRKDPGVTTEVALVLTVLTGGLAMGEPALAAAVGVTAAAVLAARTPLHHFVDKVLTEDEVRDGLILAGATLVVLPLLPDRGMGPFGALNPHDLWVVLVLILAIGAAGHVAIRFVGARYGLPVAGLVSGFVSSAATIAAMGQRAGRSPELKGPAVAGAVLSTVATIAQMSIVIGATSQAVLRALAPALAASGAMAILYGAVFTVRALRHKAQDEPEGGAAFSLTSAGVFALTLGVILLASAALRARFGDAGVLIAASLAGLVDTHAAGISVAALAAAGRLPAEAAVVPILAAMSTNTLTKAILAWTAGGPAFALRVIPGLLLVMAAAWAGALLT